MISRTTSTRYRWSIRASFPQWRAAFWAAAGLMARQVVAALIASVLRWGAPSRDSPYVTKYLTVCQPANHPILNDANSVDQQLRVGSGYGKTTPRQAQREQD